MYFFSFLKAQQFSEGSCWFWSNWALWLFLTYFCRSIFVEKFLVWKVFPIHCLRWVLQFAILECPPDANFLKKGNNNSSLLMTVQRLVEVWSKKEFVQSATIEQQACIRISILSRPYTNDSLLQWKWKWIINDLISLYIPASPKGLVFCCTCWNLFALTAYQIYLQRLVSLLS